VVLHSLVLVNACPAVDAVVSNVVARTLVAALAKNVAS